MAGSKEAVSPVVKVILIKVILMVAIIVILAAVIAAFVFGMAGTPPPGSYYLIIKVVDKTPLDEYHFVMYYDQWSTTQPLPGSGWWGTGFTKTLNTTYWGNFTPDHYYNVTPDGQGGLIPLGEVDMSPRCYPKIAPDYCVAPEAAP